ncbi:hypothetical protein [Kitasatospora sp. NPDC001132]
MNADRRSGFRNQVRITGDVASTPRLRRKAYPLGRSRTSNVVTTNHLDALLPEVREVVERVAAERGVKLIDVRVVSAVEAIIP